MLQVNGLRCIVVFDGAPLLMKQRVEEERKRVRRESQLKAVQLMQEGNLTLANKKYIEGFEITKEMIHLFIKNLK